jgi:hypothetical protein
LNHTTSTSETTRLKPQSTTSSSTKTLDQVMRRQPSLPHSRPAGGRGGGGGRARGWGQGTGEAGWRAAAAAV